MEVLKYLLLVSSLLQFRSEPVVNLTGIQHLTAMLRGFLIVLVEQISLK